MRFGKVAIVGRANVGKSTFLNSALGEDLAIVSALPQTTRDALLGVLERGEAQLGFVDTPGLARPKNELGRRMNAAALEAARAADVLVFMTDVSALAREPRPLPEIEAEDRELAARLPPGTPCVLVLNKVDRLGNKARLLPLIDAFRKIRDFEAIVPASMLDPGAVETVLTEIEKLLPEGPPGYAKDTLTDRSFGFFVREFVREQVLGLARKEVPHAVAVSIEHLHDTPRGLIARATLHVDKPGQRTILVGRGGENIKRIGIGARRRLEELYGRPVVLELFVRVTPRWRDSNRLLAEIGYEEGPPTRDSRPARRGRRPQRGRRS